MKIIDAILIGQDAQGDIFLPIYEGNEIDCIRASRCLLEIGKSLGDHLLPTDTYATACKRLVDMVDLLLKQACITADEAHQRFLARMQDMTVVQGYTDANGVTFEERIFGGSPSREGKTLKPVERPSKKWLDYWGVDLPTSPATPDYVDQMREKIISGLGIPADVMQDAMGLPSLDECVGENDVVPDLISGTIDTTDSFRTTPKLPCPDCKDGNYYGLNTVEKCATCNGERFV